MTLQELIELVRIRNLRHAGPLAVAIEPFRASETSAYILLRGGDGFISGAPIAIVSTDDLSVDNAEDIARFKAYLES